MNTASFFGPPVRGTSAHGHAKAIREWAWSRGIAVDSRGPIPKVVIEAYFKAHPEPSDAA